MARIFRFNQQSAVHLTMQAAQAAGLPVQMPQIQQGIQALLAKLAEFGIGLSVDDSSPYFQNLMANFGNNGAVHNVRPITPQAPPSLPPQPAWMQQPVAPLYQQPVAPQYPQPGQPMQPQAMRPIPGAITPGQPLPELTPPPHLQGRLPAQGITQLPGGQMPVQAPQGLGDNPAGMTNPPPLPPTILD